jgi:hypothetical protein
MNRKNSKIFLLFSLLLLVSLNISAQKNIKDLPFGVGETLVYEGKFSKIIRGIAVAEMTFSVENAPNRKDFLIRAEARSKGTLIKLFRYSFLQEISSTIDADEFRALKTVKHDVQKDRVRDSQAYFDYKDKRVTYTEVNPKEPMRPPRIIASEIKHKTHDIISGIYSLRMLPLAVGENSEIMVSDSGLVYKIPVRVTRRELQKTVLGKIWCFRVEPDVFGDNRFIEGKGSMIIWITDDARRLPVRSQINSNIGRIEVKLKSAKGFK